MGNTAYVFAEKDKYYPLFLGCFFSEANGYKLKGTN